MGKIQTDLPEAFEFMRSRMVANAHLLPKICEIAAKSDAKDPNMRIRWDLMWASVPSSWVCSDLYSKNVYDAHIDTALKEIMKSLN